MPILHFYRHRPGAYAKARIRESIITFQLTKEALSILNEVGVTGEGHSFPQPMLNNLIRSRDAYTRIDAPPEEVDDESLGQFTFDYDEDVKAASLIPRCAETGSMEDLHLVAYREAVGRRQKVAILGATIRKFSCTRIALSVPLGLLDENALEQLIDSGEITSKEPAVVKLQAWLQMERTEREKQIAA